jgi:predicted HTH transcriptional regulator
MPVCTPEVIQEILGLGYELPGIECKAGAPMGSLWILAHVLRAMAGMSNLQNGGIVIVGIKENGAALAPDPLPAQDLESWSQEGLAAKAAPYFDPAIKFHVRRVEFQGGQYVAIEVEEFEIQPTIVKADLQAMEPVTRRNKSILRRGGCYVRSTALRATQEVPTSEDMRALLDLAIQKGVNRWVQQARAADLIQPLNPAQTTPTAARDRFAEELGDL